MSECANSEFCTLVPNLQIGNAIVLETLFLFARTGDVSGTVFVFGGVGTQVRTYLLRGM